ncbi:MAG: class I SAM-dependent methyltransferase [Bacteroidales bacterium]|nr:class I SAM-dependent methyltransferase [Bacteroidales bacterium]
MLLFLLLLAAGYSKAQQRNDPFNGIMDEKVLTVLRLLSHQQGRGSIMASDGRLLYDLILEKDYKRGLEIGTSNGYSGLWIGMALKHNNGELVTLEINPRIAYEAKDNFTKAGLDQVIEVRTANALEEIPNVPGTFDFVFIDALQTDYYKYLKLVRNRVVENGAITAHDVISRAEVLSDFLNDIQNDPGLETVIHNVSQWGMSVSIVKTE